MFPITKCRKPAKTLLSKAQPHAIYETHVQQRVPPTAQKTKACGHDFFVSGGAFFFFLSGMVLENGFLDACSSSHFGGSGILMSR